MGNLLLLVELCGTPPLSLKRSKQIMTNLETKFFLINFRNKKSL